MSERQNCTDCGIPLEPKALDRAGRCRDCRTPLEVLQSPSATYGAGEATNMWVAETPTDNKTLRERVQEHLARQHDPVNHPSHYKAGGIESIDVIEAFDLNFRVGNTVKYCLRAGKKDPTKHIEDLKKARWYLDREIAALEGT